ncbi:Nucleoside diphosphate kinase [uncultured spirochete]|jgi:Nucleoside diphosphate kinase|uniref:Nucleoside diphosphate kinase n=1 Tax=uncultured spirochete TaxID=156406 RepID=A0A3P3XH19_9SPIR|nr:nucleoside-diphosphate kinase [Rectinema subterraneum]SLM11466.1 Nucleoside diphosphate kinase [uncultured spirochete]
MAIERTFAMLKPGVLSRRIAGEIISRIERKGFDIIGLKIMRITRELAEKHYAEHIGKPFFNELVAYITSSPVVAMVLEGDQAIKILRMMCGSTKPEEANPGTIRGDYAMHTNINIIHASDSPEAAAREISLFFKPEELMDWSDGNQHWI